MILDKEDLLKLCEGLVDVRENEDGSFTPVRFSKKQLEYFSRTESDRIRSYASAGINLHCDTDAEEVCIEYSVEFGSSQDIYGFDVYVDGNLAGHHEAKITETPTGRLSFSLGSGEKRLRVYFPNLAILKLRKLELAGAGYANAVARKKLLFLGDSIIQGYTTRFPSMIVASTAGRRLDMSVLNQGLAGLPFESGTLDDEIGCEPDCIAVACGTNDWNLREKAVFEAEARAYFRRLNELWHRTPVTVISPIWRADADKPVHAGFELTDVHGALAGIASEYRNVCVINGADLVPHIPGLFADRLVHPDELGFGFYADNLIAEGFMSAVRL